MMHRKAIWCLSLLALASLIADASAQGRPRPTASRPQPSSSSRVPPTSSRPTTPNFTRPTPANTSPMRINSQPLPAASGRPSNGNQQRQTQPQQRPQGQAAFLPSSIPPGQKPQGKQPVKQPIVATGQKQPQSPMKQQGVATGQKPARTGIKPQSSSASRTSDGLGLTDPRRGFAPRLSPMANEQLGKAAEKMDSKGQAAAQAAREGRLLTRPQVDELRDEAKNNKKLTPAERAVIETALQKDMDEKRKLLAANRPNVNVVLGGGGLGGGGVLGGGGDSGDATIVQPTVVGPSVVQPTVVEPTIVTGGSSEPEVTLHYNRLLKVRNSTDEKLTVYVLIAVSDGSSENWSSGSPEKTTEALVYELEAGQETYLSGDDGTLAGSRIRIWADSENGLKWAKFKTQDCVLAANAYEASEMQTYTHNFTK